MGIHPGFPSEVAFPGKQRSRDLLQQRRDDDRTAAKSKLFTDLMLFETLSLSLQVTFEKCQMKVNFPGIELLGTEPKF